MPPIRCCHRNCCEQFNTIYADYKAIDGGPNEYEDIYFAAQSAKDGLAGQNIRAPFASLSSP